MGRVPEVGDLYCFTSPSARHEYSNKLVRIEEITKDGRFKISWLYNGWTSVKSLEALNFDFTYCKEYNFYKQLSKLV